jgi:hypothetical protein
MVRSYIIRPPLFHLLVIFHDLVKTADHVEGLFRDIIQLALNQTLEALDGIFKPDVPALLACKRLRHKERLGEKFLDFARPTDDQLVVFGKLINTENRDNIL